MQVEHLMSKQVVCCSPEDSLSRAAQLMWDHDCGCLPVCTGNGASRVSGVITDRDICMSALFQGRPLAELKVADAMSRQVYTCRPTDSLADVERIMSEARIRRLPVVDAEGSLVGMITLADLAREAERESTYPRRAISGQEIGLTLASICQPATRRQAA
ncbi:MAG: CBS domain-containing protein [Pseudomonadota bacterium]|jgi:CBS domain-containing protein|nr:MAG: CBS domain-containing protein [Pseudomonadota bacterium]